jgi:hypothetical protein
MHRHTCLSSRQQCTMNRDCDVCCTFVANIKLPQISQIDAEMLNGCTGGWRQEYKRVFCFGITDTLFDILYLMLYLTQSTLAEVIAFLTWIRKVSVLNLAQDTGYPDWVFMGFHYPSRKCQNSTSNWDMTDTCMSLNTLIKSLDVIYSELPTASLNKSQINKEIVLILIYCRY